MIGYWNSFLLFQFQPKKKIKKQKDFEKNFEFNFSLVSCGNQKDPWDDLAKYVKRKPNNKSYERIDKVRKEIKKVNNIFRILFYICSINCTVILITCIS